jgi:hypothetical protein
VNARLAEYRAAAGIPPEGPPPIPCFGACKGIAGVKLPQSGLHCTVCHGAGKLFWQDHDDAADFTSKKPPKQKLRPQTDGP